MKNTTNPSVANATNATFTKPVKGFTYVRDFAAITIELYGKLERVIIGSKDQFPMRDMFELKQAESVTIMEIDPRTVNGQTYRRFVLQSINLSF